jgi:alanine dehydrogenase
MEASAISNHTLLLSRPEVAALLSLRDCIDAVERAFIASAQGRAPRPGVLGFPTIEGGFHIKAASLPGDPPYFAAKLNGNFFHNRERFAMPNIQGVIILSHATNGAPLALLDSIEITILRTGAATGVAARRLARPDARVVTICGCGNQGRVSLRALREVRKIERAYLWDLDPEAAARLAQEFSAEDSFEARAVGDLRSATRASDVIVTCTPSKRAFIGPDHVSPGTFVAAVGADNEEKSEIEPELMARSRVVVDSREQCSKIGDLHHALETGMVSVDRGQPELGEILAGAEPGRRDDSEIIVFDSTGTALQDVAAAALVYERARAAGRGMKFEFNPAGVTC